VIIARGLAEIPGAYNDPMLDPALEAAYRAADYRVDGPHGSFVLRIGEPCADADRLLATHGQTEWAYVTACNPRSVCLPDEENAPRTAELEVALRDGGWPHHRGISVGRNGGWAEASFLVLGIPEGEAVALGRRFGQNAIVAGRAGEPARLVWVT